MSQATYTNWTGSSRWTSASRNHAVHISKGTGGPLCGKSYGNGTLDRWPLNLSEITCEKCRKKYEQLITEPQTETA